MPLPVQVNRTKGPLDMNSLKSHEQKFWQAYLQEAGVLDSNGLTVSAGMPGDEQIADELVSLYLNGQKTAGSGLLKDYEQAGDPLPEVGNFWIILDSHARPRCIVRVIRVEMHLFREVTEEIARAEGEGDLSLEYWRKAHQWFFSRFLEKLGITNLNEERIVVEFYELVYRERAPAAPPPPLSPMPMIAGPCFMTPTRIPLSLQMNSSSQSFGSISLTNLYLKLGAEPGATLENSLLRATA